MSKDSFYRNTFILTASNIGTGVFGFIFSVTLSRSLGAEGMGLYNLVMPVYNLFVCIMSAGMVAALSKASAIYHENNDYKNLYKTISTITIFNLIWALFITVIFFFLNDFLVINVLRDSRTTYALLIICPAMIFITLSNILKGYFYGISKVTVPAVIDIFEKGIRILMIVVLLRLIDSTSITMKITVSYLALTIGELVSLVLLFIYYKYYKINHSYSRSRTEGRAQLLYNVLSVSVPLCLMGILTSLLSTLSALIVPRRLVASGIPYNTALELIGKFAGMSLLIVFFPMVIINSLNTVLIPDLSKSVSKKDYASLERRIKNVLLISLVLGMCSLIICNTIPTELGTMLFKRDDLGPYIKFASYSAPLFYTAVATYGILNGIGKQNILLRNAVSISVLEIILLFILTSIPSINIFGYGITMIVTSVLTLAANLYEIKKHYEINISLINLLIYCLLGFLIFYVIQIINGLMLPLSLILRNILIIISGFSFFILSLLLTRKYK